MGNDEGGRRFGVGAERRAEPSRPEQSLTISTAPMTHCLRINRRGTANSSEKTRAGRAAFFSVHAIFISFFSSRSCTSLSQSIHSPICIPSLLPHLPLLFPKFVHNSFLAWAKLN